jgi:nitrogenase molybdenum-cofactor synthesis protein NifE
VELAKELEETLYSPIWKQVRQPAPWEEGILRNVST